MEASVAVGEAKEVDPEVASFEANGFLGPITVYDPDEAKEMLHRIRVGNQDRSRVLFDNDVNYDRHFDIPELAEHIANPTILGVLKKLLGPDLLCWRSEFFPKFPGAKGTEWHQVSNYQYATGRPMLEPTEPRADHIIDLTVWTAFTEATRSNGCMKFLPGTHERLYYDESRTPQRGRDADYVSIQASTAFFGYDFEDFKIDPAWIPDENEAVAMELAPGQCVIFSARCVHGSFPNTTQRSTRFAIATRYVPTSVRVYPEWREFRAHGGHFDLSNYGTVLVSGRDHYGHNRIRTTDNHGRPFPRLP